MPSVETELQPTSAPDAERVSVFDGHNDVLLHLSVDERRRRTFLTGGDRGHLDLPRARAGGLAGGLFAIFTPGGLSIAQLERLARDDAGGEMIPAADETQALREGLSMFATLQRVIRDAGGQVAIARTTDEVTALMRTGRLAIVLHLEGAEAIDSPGLDTLEVLAALGLRSLGLVWSRPNAFGQGVPLRFPSTADIGPGLTRAGRQLVDACNSLGVMIDLAHLNEQGFWDVARRSRAPLVVTHAGAHAIAPSSRNLTDAQLDAVAASGGVVGVTFNVSDLRNDGRKDPDTALDIIIHHLDHIAGRVGIAHVALGSDFDGAVIPTELGSAAGIPRLIQRLRQRGYDEDSVRQVAHANWLRVLADSWGT